MALANRAGQEINVGSDVAHAGARETAHKWPPRDTGTRPLAETGGLAASFFFIICITWLRGAHVEGPAIFADEAVYFDLGRKIFFHGNFGGHGQYNPLYPFLIAPWFALGDVIHTYQAARIINAVAFSSIIFPAYLLARFFLARPHAFFFSLSIALLPYSSITPIIWAEPVFYPLHLLCVYYFVRFLSLNSYTSSCMLGVSLAILFYAKQSALILAISIFLSLFFYLIFIENKRILSRRIAISFLIFILLILPWIFRNIFTGDIGLFGYNQRLIRVSLTNFLDLDFFVSVLYQFSYLVLSLFIIGFSLFLNIFLNLFRFSIVFRFFSFFVLLNSILIILLCAVHRYIDNNIANMIMPYGRYISVLIPLMLLCIWYYAFSFNFKSYKFWLSNLSILFFLLIICIFFPPIARLSWYSCINNFDISWFNAFLSTSKIGYNHEKFGNYFILSVSIVFLMSFMLYFFRNLFVFIFALCFIINGFCASYYVNIVLNSQSVSNCVYKYILENKDKYVIDSLAGFNNSNIRYWNLFWLGENASAPILLARLFVTGDRTGITFGDEEGARADGVELRGDVIYSPSKGLGFDSLKGVAFANLKVGGGWKKSAYADTPSRLYFDSGPGKYHIVVKSPFMISGEVPVDFSLMINGEPITHGPPEEPDTLVAEGTIKAVERITLDFSPVAGCSWAVAEILIARENWTPFEDWILITSAKMPMKLQNTIETFYLYKIQ